MRLEALAPVKLALHLIFGNFSYHIHLSQTCLWQQESLIFLCKTLSVAIEGLGQVVNSDLNPGVIHGDGPLQI